MNQEQKDAVVQAILFMAENDGVGAKAALATEFTPEIKDQLYDFIWNSEELDDIQNGIADLVYDTDRAIQEITKDLEG